MSKTNEMYQEFLKRKGFSREIEVEESYTCMPYSKSILMYTRPPHDPNGTETFTYKTKKTILDDLPSKERELFFDVEQQNTLDSIYQEVSELNKNTSKLLEAMNFSIIKIRKCIITITAIIIASIIFNFLGYFYFY